MKLRALLNSAGIYILFCTAFTLISIVSYAQARLTFSIDMQDLIDSSYFKPDDQLVVRGSFNDWSGRDMELSADDRHPAVFSLTVELDVEKDDKLEFKYVIISVDGAEYWESNPNPDNPGYGNRVLMVSGTEMTVPITRFVYGDDVRGRVLSWEDKLKADFRQARMLLEENHPALYDYSTKEAMDSLFDGYYALIDSSMSTSIFYQNLSFVLAHIGCGHTKLFIPESYWAASPDRFFPLQILVTEKKIMITGAYSNEKEIPVGSEIIAINDVPAREIINKLYEQESSDGFIASFRYNSIQKRFPLKYALNYGYPEVFSITYIPAGHTAPANRAFSPASKELIDPVLKRGDELSFNQVEGHDAAVMTINTFGYYSEVPMFRAFIDSSFQVLNDQNIGNLIIDLRGNDGGDPYCASYMFSYLQKEPVPYFIKPYHHYDTLARPIYLPENHYTGKTYVIIDGGGFSTTGHVCGLMKYHKLVSFVGTELGATYTCTGNVMYPPLNNTQIFLGTARESRYTAAVEGMNAMQGVEPDYVVETRQEDILQGRDAQMEYILGLLSQ